MANSRRLRVTWRSTQRGAAMVEMAITISLFLALVFAILEFSIAIFQWSRVVEATRAGARYAIVNEPACDIYGTGLGAACPDPLDCDDPLNSTRTVSVTGNCTLASPLSIADAGCSIVEQMRQIQPLIAQSAGATVDISYSCSDAGFVDLLDKIPVVSVAIAGVQYEFIVPTVIGIDDASITMPAFETTRTGEDLGTVFPAAP